MATPFIPCFQADDKFGKTTNPISTDGSVSIKFIYKDAIIDYSKREYQREDVAPLEFKQGILVTVLNGGFKKIPQIHIRVIKVRTENATYFTYELIDGQQRVTSVTGFLKGEFSLPKSFILSDGRDISGFTAKQLETTYMDLYQKILNYEISCVWYENISDAQTAELFVEVLNRTNDMKPQEIRNAVRGLFSTWVRDTARGWKEMGKKPHKLFQRTEDGKSMKIIAGWPSKKLQGRMEVDEWLSELVYMVKNGWKSGVSQTPHTKWVKNMQKPGGDYENKFIDKKEMETLLNFGYDLLKSVPTKYKSKLSPMLSQVLILYANDLKTKYGKLIPSKYTKSFFKVYSDWSCQTKQLYKNGKTYNGNQLGEFHTLFGGKNVNALNTICGILDEELKNDISAFGVVEIDLRDFTNEQIYQKWKEQGGLDYWTKLPIDFEDAVGDHYIPRSEGILLGGVTEYHNLVVTSDVNNRMKSNMNPDSFSKQVA